MTQASLKVGLARAVAVLVVVAAGGAGAAPRPAPKSILLSIGGGTPDSAAFKWSAALAETVSRPPGLPECEAGTACGVPNVVASAQTYDDPAALMKAVADGNVATAVLPALPLLHARCKAGKTAPPLFALKILYRQPVYIVTGNTPGKIEKPRDWIGKTVMTGTAGSDADIVTTAMLAAYDIPHRRVKLRRVGPPAALEALQKGKATVGFFVGHAFDGAIRDLLARGFKLMSLPESTGRKKLLEAEPALEPGALPADSYPALPATSILMQPVVWVAGPQVDAKLAQSLVTAVTEAHNQARLAELTEPLSTMPEAESFTRLPLPLADGVEAVAKTASAPVSVIDCPAKRR